MVVVVTAARAGAAFLVGRRLATVVVVTALVAVIARATVVVVAGTSGVIAGASSMAASIRGADDAGGRNGKSDPTTAVGPGRRERDLVLRAVAAARHHENGDQPDGGDGRERSPDPVRGGRRQGRPNGRGPRPEPPSRRTSG